MIWQKPPRPSATTTRISPAAKPPAAPSSAPTFRTVKIELVSKGTVAAIATVEMAFGKNVVRFADCHIIQASGHAPYVLLPQKRWWDTTRAEILYRSVVIPAGEVASPVYGVRPGRVE